MFNLQATNRHGEATVTCKLQVRGRQGIVLEPQLPSDFRTGTESIQKLEESLYKREEILQEDEKPNPPRFTVELKVCELYDNLIYSPSNADINLQKSICRILWTFKRQHQLISSVVLNPSTIQLFALTGSSMAVHLQLVPVFIQ